MAKRKTAKRPAGRAGQRAKTKAGRGTAKQARTASGARRKASSGRTGARASTARKKTPTKGSPTRAGASGQRRKRRQQPEDVTAQVQERWDMEDDDVPTPPSTLGYQPPASAARSGRAALERRRRAHTAASPAITGGDIDADWEGAYTVGDEAATSDNPTPDQDTVEGLGRAVGVDYEDSEELKSTPKVDRRDKKRWELDPASSEDYKERTRRGGKEK